MRVYLNCKTFVFLIVSLLLVACFIPVSMTRGVNQSYEQCSNRFNGQILFAPMNSQTTYLIDTNGNINHTWPSTHTPGQSVYMLDDGVILRTKRMTFSAPGGAGGGVEKIAWDGTVLWHFTYYTSNYLSHHDIEPLPNGNILMIAWEYRTRNEAIAAGRNPNFLNGNTIMPDHIIEVEPTGSSGGNIVWEWHVWDHLIQDYDPTKDNYGVVADHPELVDFNFGTSNADWLHCNSVDYHEEFDQILVSVHNFNEIWVIDHSTTTGEAAGHSGGNSGKGGDILYRWGNPSAYDAGTSSDRKLFGQHDASWIETGHPGEGNILVFNNGQGRPGPDYSSIDEIVPPVDDSGNYYLEPGAAYGPENQIWMYTASNFYASFISGAHRLGNGNTLICDGPAGKFFEVTPEGVTIWEYVNNYPNPFYNNVFKIYYYEPELPPPEDPDLDCEGALQWTDVNIGETVNGSFEVYNVGGSGSLLNWEITSYPSWGTWSFTPESGESLTPEDGPITVQVSVIAPDDENTEFEGTIQIENQENSEDFDVIPVYLKTPRKRAINTPFFNLLNNVIKYLIFNMLDRA